MTRDLLMYLLHDMCGMCTDFMDVPGLCYYYNGCVPMYWNDLLIISCGCMVTVDLLYKESLLYSGFMIQNKNKVTMKK